MNKLIQLTLAASISLASSQLFAFASDKTTFMPLFESKPCDSACFERFKVIRKYAMHGNPQAMVLLATAYLTGEGQEYNPERAEIWLRRADNVGSTKATWMRAQLYKAGLGVEKDLEKYHFLLNKAVKRNYGPALFAVAADTILQDGFNDDAVNMLKRAKADGYKQASYLLAKMYETGQGVAQDKLKAAQIYKTLPSYKESRKRFDIIKQQAKVSNAELFSKVEALGDMEVIEVVGQSIDYNLQLDNVITLFKSESSIYDKHGGTGSRIPWRKCTADTGCKIAAANPEESKTLLRAAVRGGIRSN